MRLLISNDDGIFAQGIRVLANTLARAGHQVTVVCPDRERSATGHGLTMHDPIRAEPVAGIFDANVQAWACSGTPSDCVKLALGALLDQPPDFVLSGINHGANLGTDILYSGTVAAAMEGVIEGIPSMALSLTSFTIREFQPGADFAAKLLAHFAQYPLQEPTLLNINIPAVPTATIAGIKVTRQGLRRYTDTFQKRVDPRGKTYYWLSGEVLQDIAQPKHLQLPPEVETDVQAIKGNYITIVPLYFNLTYPPGVDELQRLGLDKIFLAS
jgi:5'-nucleotidase